MNPPEAGRRGCTRMHAFGGNGNDGAKSRRAEEARSWGNGGGIAFRAFGLRGVGGGRRCTANGVLSMRFSGRFQLQEAAPELRRSRMGSRLSPVGSAGLDPSHNSSVS